MEIHVYEKQIIFQKSYSGCCVKSILRVVKVGMGRTVQKTMAMSRVACTRVLAVKR